MWRFPQRSAWLVYRARRELPFHWMMTAFAIFIVACGATHFMEVWTLTAEHPRYWLAGWVKLITAVASVTTAIFLPLLVPRILGLMAAARVSAEQGQKLERAYGELNALYAKVTQLDQLKTNFFANVSHELRTPLTLIFAPIERLLQTASDPATQRELTVVRRNALLLHKHVNDLLDVSKLEMSKMELHYSRLDVAAMARAMAGIFDSVIGERGVQVIIETPAEAIAEVDGDKIQRVFMNLLSNAFKYAPEYTAVQLHASRRIQATTSCSSSRTPGPGVPPELRTKIFERFQQGDRETQRRYGGTGLGLSIVREFVEMHRGTISLGEGESGGAQFRVILPRRAPQGVEIHASPWATSDGVVQRLTAPHSAGQPAPAPPAPVANGASRPDVLVVEDNRDMRELICRVLEPEARTRSAEHGRAALEEMRQRVPDLVLMDLMMPVMTGDEMLAAMRQDERMRDVPVILLTAKADEDMKLNLLTGGAQDYVMKPFSIDELRARVRNQLQTKRTRDTLPARPRFQFGRSRAQWCGNWPRREPPRNPPMRPRTISWPCSAMNCALRSRPPSPPHPPSSTPPSRMLPKSANSWRSSAAISNWKPGWWMTCWTSPASRGASSISNPSLSTCTRFCAMRSPTPSRSCGKKASPPPSISPATHLESAAIPPGSLRSSRISSPTPRNSRRRVAR